MRESRRTERMHLPRDSTEAWLESQRVRKHHEAKHRNPPKDPLEAWIERRVEDALRSTKAEAKAAA
jgi:hypothetical protein